MKTLGSVLVFLMLSWSAIAGETPTKAFTGKVFDKTTHEALAGVKVSLENSNQYVYTDMNGQFTLLVNTQQSSVLKFSTVGYADEKTIVNNSSSSLNIQLAEL